MSHLTIIVAATKSNGIGQSGKLPWRLSKEIAYFARVTSSAPEGQRNAVIMGRKTWESIPANFRPLSKRFNVVVSHNEDYELYVYFLILFRHLFIEHNKDILQAVSSSSPLLKLAFGG
jgi:dihydrofolate reductase